MQSHLSPSCDCKPVGFLIVTALKEERDAVLSMLNDLDPVRVDQCPTYYVCTLPAKEGGHNVAVTQLSRMGNVHAGIHAAYLIDHLSPACVLMVGIAAGVRGQISLGDVAISTQVFYYEQAKQTPRGPEIRPIVMHADPSLLQAAQNFDDSDWRSLIGLEKAQREGSHLPTVHFGPFAVGDKVVADEEYVCELMKLHPKLIGIEMESYGVAAAAASSTPRPRFLAIRGISDFADEWKDDRYRQRASSVAAAFAIGLLRRGPLPAATLHSRGTDRPLEQTGSFIAIRHLSMQRVPSRSILESLPSQFVGREVTEVLIDQTDLYKNGRLTNPMQAVRRQRDLDDTIDSLLDSQPGSEVGYFGIAHIPLSFHSGCSLTNKRRLRFFEFKRYTGQWDHLQGKNAYPALKVHGLPTQVTTDSGDVVVRVSISNTVRLEEVARIVPSPIASLHLCIEPPQRDVLTNESQLHAYGASFRRTLDAVHELLPNRECTHLFYAGPVSLAVFLGQLIIPTIDRRVLVYNYTAKDSPRYSWGLEVTTETHSPGFLVRAERHH